MIGGVNEAPVPSSGDSRSRSISAFEKAKGAVEQIIWDVKIGKPFTGKEFFEFLSAYINNDSLGQMNSEERRGLAECLDLLGRELYGRNIHVLEYEIESFKTLLQGNDRGQKSQSDGLLSRIWRRLFGGPSAQKPIQASPERKTSWIFGLGGLGCLFQKIFGKR